MAAVFLCLGAYAQGVSTVRCMWDDSTQQYVCSGTGGSIIEVQGGGVIIQTVTNFLGACTNCINTTPEMCLEIRNRVLSDAEYAINKAGEIPLITDTIKFEVDRHLEEISSFQRSSDLPYGSAGFDFVSFSNYVWGTENSQTLLVRSHWPRTLNTAFQRYAVSYNNGIYDYANGVTKPQLSGMKQYADSIDSDAVVIKDRVLTIWETVSQNLNCNACPGGDDGSGDCNECTGGKWCTEEQGDAITNLLYDTKEYVQRLHDVVISISNGLQVAIQTLHEGLFTSYTHIPTEEELGHTWQELYLEGYSPNFHEYASTNILARIELLLAGMSGVLTNSSDFASAGEFAENGMAATNEFDSIVNDFTNEVASAIDVREANIRSVGDALVNLYDTFRGWSGTPFSRQTLINSYSVEIGADHYDVPGFEPSESGLYVANLIRLVCRSVMSVIYILFTVAVFVRFHIAFFQWVWKYLKWGVELMQGLFA